MNMLQPRWVVYFIACALIASCIQCGTRNIDQSILDHELLSAAANGNTAAAEQVLKKGARIEATDENGKTPLIVAAERDATPTVRLLLDRGAKVDTRDNSGWTALVHAAYSSHWEALALLLPKATWQDKNEALVAAAGFAPVQIKVSETDLGQLNQNSRLTAETQDSPEVKTVKMLLAH